MTETTPPTPPPAKPEVKLGKAGKITSVLIAAALIGWIGWISLRANEPQAPDGYDARAACRELVKDRLRSPASAQFSDLAHRGSGVQFVVTGIVDSENAFGAMIRNSFTCEVRLDGEYWRLVRLDGLTN